MRSAADLTQRNRIGLQVGRQELKTPAVWMSHGYQGTMAWIADLVGQIFLEAKSPVPAKEMEGIVLIDEIDLHLHPSWQVELIPALKQVFPRIQFIATTHSPSTGSGGRATRVGSRPASRRSATRAFARLCVVGGGAAAS